MSKLPEDVIEAACWAVDDSYEVAVARARRVILALANDLPESAVEKAWTYIATSSIPKVCMIDRGDLRAAIIAALEDVVGSGAIEDALAQAEKALEPFDDIPAGSDIESHIESIIGRGAFKVIRAALAKLRSLST